MAFVLALLKTWSDFFHAGMEGDGTLGTQGAASISTQLLPHHNFHTWVLGMLSLQSCVRVQFLQITVNN